MARVTAPLFSLGASGAIGKAIVYADWRGLDYARRYVIPANPKSANQQEVRGVFSTLNEMWKRMPIGARNPFIEASTGKPYTDRNLFISKSAKALKGKANLNDLVMSVASGQAIQPINVVLTPGANQCLVVGEAPPAPVGYTFIALCAAFLLDGDPSPLYVASVIYDDDAAAPYSFTVSGLETGVNQAAVWGRWQRDSDLHYFYSEAIRSQETIT